MASSHCRYSGLSTFRKLARHQIMKTWPIFSSTVSERKVFSAHLSPRAVLTGAGRACLSLPSEGRVRARMRAITGKIRGIGGTIAEATPCRDSRCGAPMLGGRRGNLRGKPYLGRPMWGQPPPAVLRPQARCLSSCGLHRACRTVEERPFEGRVKRIESAGFSL